MTEMLTAEDRIAIRELLALYGHVIDERQFSRVDELFTPDGRYDVSDFGQGVHHSPAAIAALWADPGSRHPLAHHTVDVVVTEDGDGRFGRCARASACSRTARRAASRIATS